MTSRKTKSFTLDLASREAGAAIPSAPAEGQARRRLAEGFISLQAIDSRRAHGHASLLDRLSEQRIIWRELLELELQSMLRLDGLKTPGGHRNG